MGDDCMHALTNYHIISSSIALQRIYSIVGRLLEWRRWMQIGEYRCM